MVWYADGSIQVAANGQVATGTGTAFLKNVRIGDGLTIAGSTSMHEVTNIASDTQLTFSPPYSGAAGAGKQYRIAPIQGYVKEAADLLRALTQNLGSFANNANLTALAAAVGGANRGLMFTGPGAIGTFDLSAQGRAFLAAATQQAQRTMLGFDREILGVSITDADANTVEGIHRVGAVWTGSPYPGTNSANQGSIEHILLFASSAYVAQMFWPLSGLVNAPMYRRKVNGVWESWQSLWTEKNLVKQSNPSDFTPGAALLNAAHGLGTQTPQGSIDANANTVTGFYVLSGSAANRPDTSNGGWSLQVSGCSPNYTAQRASRPNGGGAGAGILSYTRWQNNGVWTNWYQEWNSHSLPIQVSTTDASPGVVMLNGGHGLGGASIIRNSIAETNAARQTEITRNGAGGASSPYGRPIHGLHINSTASYESEIVADMLVNRFYGRTRPNTTEWLSMVEFWHTGNLTPNKLEDRTLATLPAAGANKGQMFLCTNTPRGNRPVYSDGSSWLKIEDNTLATAA